MWCTDYHSSALTVYLTKAYQLYWSRSVKRWWWRDYRSCFVNEEFRVHCTKARCTSSDLRIYRNYSPKIPRWLTSYSRILFPEHSASSESVTLCSCLYGTPLFITVRTKHYAGIYPKQVNKYSFLKLKYIILLKLLSKRMHILFNI